MHKSSKMWGVSCVLSVEVCGSANPPSRCLSKNVDMLGYRNHDLQEKGGVENDLRRDGAIIESRSRNDQDLYKASSGNQEEKTFGEVEAKQVGSVRKPRILGCADRPGATCKVTVHSEMSRHSSP